MVASSAVGILFPMEAPHLPPDRPNGTTEARYGAVERRKQPTKMLSRWSFVGQRRGGRRDGEQDYVYVDRPGGWMALAFATLLALSLLDAWFTLDLIRSGATEANPFMRAALTLGNHAFVLIKTVITIAAVGFLCLHKNWPLGRMCLMMALYGYSALILYHLYAKHLVTTAPM